MAEAEGREEEGILGALVEIGTDVAAAVHGLPPPIKKSLFKAVGQLMTAAVEVPIAYLEDKAADIRAGTAGRRLISDAAATQIAAQMHVPESFVQAAGIKASAKLVRERVTMNDIGKIAIEDLLKDEIVKPTSALDGEALISDDWLNSFEMEGAQKSSEDMKVAFGKILAGEIRRPGSFSIKTLRLLGQLDPEVAALFKVLCSATTALWTNGRMIDARVLSLEGNAGTNALEDFGLGFGKLNILQEFGLVIADYNSWMTYRGAVPVGNQVSNWIRIGQLNLALVPQQPLKPDELLKFSGVALTKVGCELYSIIEAETNASYFESLTTSLKGRGFGLAYVNVTDTPPTNAVAPSDD